MSSDLQEMGEDENSKKIEISIIPFRVIEKLYLRSLCYQIVPDLLGHPARAGAYFPGQCLVHGLPKHL